MPHLLENVRLACGKAAERASNVRIDTEAIPGYAASLPWEELALPKMDPAIHYLGHGRDTTAYLLTLDTVNFGSGYFPDILGDTVRSGYRTIASALKDYFEAHGPAPAAELRLLDAADCAKIFGQNMEDRAAAELMGLFAKALNDLGRFLAERFDGEFARVVETAGCSAERLVELLTVMPLFNDTAICRGLAIPFYKRAQLAAADLFIAFGGEGAGRFDDIDLLTICADNLVPHVLRLDGILHYREGLLARIEGGEPIPAGSVEEVEIRACAVHAAELIIGRLRRSGERFNAMMLDNFLWHRGQKPFYRAHPRHRTRTVFY